MTSPPQQSGLLLLLFQLYIAVADPLNAAAVFGFGRYVSVARGAAAFASVAEEPRRAELLTPGSEVTTGPPPMTKPTNDRHSSMPLRCAVCALAGANNAEE